jgi:hypothetical protein
VRTKVDIFVIIALLKEVEILWTFDFPVATTLHNYYYSSIHHDNVSEFSYRHLQSYFQTSNAGSYEPLAMQNIFK